MHHATAEPRLLVTLNIPNLYSPCLYMYHHQRSNTYRYSTRRRSFLLRGLALNTLSTFNRALLPLQAVLTLCHLSRRYPEPSRYRGGREVRWTIQQSVPGYTGVTWPYIAHMACSNPSYHSANPISLPSQAHQISSSSSLASVIVIAGAAAGWDVRSSGLVWQVTRTPSVLMLAAPRRRGLPSPLVDATPPRPESTRKSCSMFSSDVLTFCRGSHAGCEKPRGARSNTCVCVAAANRHG
jgi:hypothetical protein